MRKRALVCRISAAGDIIMASAVLPYLKKDGYEVHFMASKIGMEILAHNPNIDRLIYYPADSVPIEKLDGFFDAISQDYDKVVNLVGSIEESMLFAYPSEMWYSPLPKRRKRCTENYYLKGIRLAGYEPNGLRTGQLFFSQEDLIFAKNFRKKYKDNFLIVAALSGSSTHKVYIYWHQVAQRILDEIPEAVIVATGTPHDMTLSFNHPRVINFGLSLSPIMCSFALAQVADLVIGPETALLNAAGCFDTPKICLLSHSEKHNLTSTWENDYSLQSATHCGGCHNLMKTTKIWKDRCPLDKVFFHKYGAEIPACAGEGFPPDLIFDTVAKVYNTHFRR